MGDAASDAATSVGEKRSRDEMREVGRHIDPDDYETDYDDMEQLQEDDKYANMRHRDLKTHMLEKMGRASVWKRRNGSSVTKRVCVTDVTAATAEDEKGEESSDSVLGLDSTNEVANGVVAKEGGDKHRLHRRNKRKHGHHDRHPKEKKRERQEKEEKTKTKTKRRSSSSSSSSSSGGKKDKRRKSYKKDLCERMAEEVSIEAKDLQEYTNEILAPPVEFVGSKTVKKVPVREERSKRMCAEKYGHWPMIDDPDDTDWWSWKQELALRKGASFNDVLKDAILRGKIHEGRKKLREVVKRTDLQELLSRDKIIDEMCTLWFASLIASCVSPLVAMKIIKTLYASKCFFLPGHQSLLDKLIKRTQCGHYYIDVALDGKTNFTIRHQYMCPLSGMSKVGVQRFYFNPMDGEQVISLQTRSRTLPGINWNNSENTSTLGAAITHMYDTNYIARALTFPVSRPR